MLALGTVLQQRYRIDRALGQGGMGVVYETFDLRLNCTVALKETLCADPRLRRAFEHEARLLANLQHPSLPAVSDHFIEGEGQFLVMRFIPGQDLGTLLEARREPFPLREVLQWADQLLAVLEYLHTHQPPIVHRDIKPGNLKLAPDGTLYLLDFGLAKGALGYSTPFAANPPSLAGYTWFFSPLEQIQGSGTDPRSDIYAVGATLYCLLTGAHQPDAITRATARLEQRADPLPPAHTLHPQVPAGLAALLQEAMAMEPAARPSATDLRRGLRTMRAALEESTTSVPPRVPEPVRDEVIEPGPAASRPRGDETTRPVPPAPRPLPASQPTPVPVMPTPRRRWPVWVLAGALLAVVAAAGLVRATQSEAIRTLEHTDSVYSVAFASDGGTLASGSGNYTVKLWDVASGQELRTLRGHINTVDSVAFTSDGRTLASGSWDRTVKLWDVQAS